MKERPVIESCRAVRRRRKVSRLRNFIGADRRSGRLYRSGRMFMVTLSMLHGLPPMSELSRDGWKCLKFLPVTRLLSAVLRDFVRHSPIRVYQPYIFMPDHIHMIIQLRTPLPEGLSLLKLLAILRFKLSKAFRLYYRLPEHTKVFESHWHDYLVRDNAMLNNFNEYIVNNAREALEAKACPDRKYLRRVEAHWRLRKRCWYSGDLGLLDRPDFVAVQYTGGLHKETPAWEAACRDIDGWPPELVGISCFYSPMEQEAYDRILAHGGSLVVFLPKGFDVDNLRLFDNGRQATWHPRGEQTRALWRAGRILFLSFVEPGHRPDLARVSEKRRCLAHNATAARMAAFVRPKDSASPVISEILPDACQPARAGCAGRGTGRA